MAFDFSLFNAIHGLAGKLWFVDWIGIFFARYFSYTLVFIPLFIFFHIKEWRYRFWFAGLCILSVITARGLATEAIRFFYDRSRPFEVLDFAALIPQENTGSFPSGHATAYFALGTAIFLFLRKYPQFGKKKGLWMFFGALLMGLGRVFAGVHWPTDIIGGAAIGIISAYVAYGVLPKPETISDSKFEARNPKSEINSNI